MCARACTRACVCANVCLCLCVCVCVSARVTCLYCLSATRVVLSMSAMARATLAKVTLRSVRAHKEGDTQIRRIIACEPKTVSEPLCVCVCVCVCVRVCVLTHERLPEHTLCGQCFHMSHDCQPVSHTHTHIHTHIRTHTHTHTHTRTGAHVCQNTSQDKTNTSLICALVHSQAQAHVHMCDPMHPLT